MYQVKKAEKGYITEFDLELFTKNAKETDERHRYGADSSATSAFSLVSRVWYVILLFYFFLNATGGVGVVIPH